MTAHTPISFAEFQTAALAQGFDEVLQRQWAPDLVVDTHRHSFSVQALMVQGEMWLSCGNVTRHLQQGDRFELAYEAPHAERYGPQGATYWVARRNAPA